MEGGIVVTDDEELYHYMLAIRAHGWTRNIPKNSKLYKKNESDFYESFNFIVPGFNIRPLELEGALGIEQLKKIDSIIRRRRENYEYFKQKIGAITGIRTQKEIGKSSWFGFAIILEKDFPLNRDLVVNELSKNNIDVRPVVAGNFTRNSVIKYMDYTIFDSLENADDIHYNGFFVGNHSNSINKQIDYLFEILMNILK
jgi:CDP-6-deoxy-D-xylo-4-hexulose-3-dehydrase